MDGGEKTSKHLLFSLIHKQKNTNYISPSPSSFSFSFFINSFVKVFPASI